MQRNRAARPSIGAPPVSFGFWHAEQFAIQVLCVVFTTKTEKQSVAANPVVRASADSPWQPWSRSFVKDILDGTHVTFKINHQ